MGPRRSGKSTLALQALKGKSFLYFNFDDEFLSQCTSLDLSDLVELGKSINPVPQYLFFDEIQNIEGWEFFINKLHRKKINVILTGSNSRLLSSELTSHLTGRHISIELYPLSFVEFLKIKKWMVPSNLFLTSEEKTQMKNYFLTYLKRGGFPEISLGSDESRYAEMYLKELYDKIIGRDIVERRKIKNSKVLREVALLAMSSYASTFTYQSIKKNSLQKSVSTIKNYIGYLQESYLIFVVEPFSFKTKERVSLPKKFYAIDTALARTVSGLITQDNGKNLENLIFIELKRRSKEIYNVYTPSFEIDFLIREGRSVAELIQVSWSIEDPKTKERELKALIKGALKYKCSKLTLITFDQEETITIDQFIILVIPAWKWCLA